MADQFEYSEHFKRSAAERAQRRIPVPTTIIERDGKFFVVGEDRELNQNEIVEG